MTGSSKLVSAYWEDKDEDKDKELRNSFYEIEVSISWSDLDHSSCLESLYRGWEPWLNPDPVLEIDKCGKRAWRTKDIWEDQKT